eukprot:COSAG02_NODE_1629_length_11581_cov_5.858735_4_plen_766_part_00
MRYVAPGRVALANEDLVDAAEPKILHDRVDMAQAGRLGGAQREELLRWLSGSVGWPRQDWRPATALPTRMPLRGPAEFVRYDYRWKPGDTKFKSQGKKGNFPRDDEGASLVIDNFVQPLHEMEAKRLLRQTSDGCMVAQLISSCRPSLSSVIPSGMVPCADVRGEEGVAMRRANWQLLSASGVWKRLRMSVPSDEEENQLARALPYRAERLLWTLHSKLKSHATPAQILAKQKEQRKLERIAAVEGDLTQENLLDPDPNLEPQQASTGSRPSTQARVAQRPVLRLDKAARRKKAVQNLLRSVAGVLGTRPDDEHTEWPPWTAGIRHGMDLSPQRATVRTGDTERPGGRRVFGRPVQSAEDLFEAVALGPVQPPQVASLALGKEADDALALANAKARKAKKKKREAQHAQVVAKRAVEAAKTGRSRVAWASGETEVEAARAAEAAAAAAAAAAAQLQMEEAVALRNAAEAQRNAMQVVTATSMQAAHVDAVPFDKLCSAIERLGLPLSDRAALAEELNAVHQGPHAPAGGLMVSRAAWLRALGDLHGMAEPNTASARATESMASNNRQLESDTAAGKSTCEDEPVSAVVFRPLASFSSWKAEGYDQAYLTSKPEIRTDAGTLSEANGARNNTDLQQSSAAESPPAGSRASAGTESWGAAIAAVDRAAQHQAARAVPSYHFWRSAEASRAPPPPPPTAQAQLVEASAADVGQRADAMRGYSGWATRMDELFGQAPQEQTFQQSRASGSYAHYNQKMRQLFARPASPG